jgi:hypothetical protein
MKKIALAGWLTALPLLAAGPATATTAAVTPAAPISILFVGNSYTFGRLDPVLSYNAANVRDLTQPQGPLNGGRDPALAFTTGAPFTNLTGTNSYPAGTLNPATGTAFTSYSPHSASQAWGGVPGIFKQMTVQAGLHYDVALSSRNAASLRGHFLNTANSNWNLRGNITSQRWDKVVLQEQSDEPLPAKTVGGVALGANFGSFQAYANLIENHLHQGNALSYKDSDLFAGGSTSIRTIGANANANAAAQLYLQQTWARPNLINAPGATALNPATGNASYSGAAAPSFYADLEAMTADLHTAYAAGAAHAATDHSGGFTAIAPVGDAFLRAVSSGVATRNLYAADAGSDGLIDLWFNDGTHASKYGSYLSALTLFGTVTGLDPQSLGAAEQAAIDLGISMTDAVALQRVAALELGFAAQVPEPTTGGLLAAGLATLAVWARRRNVKA